MKLHVLLLILTTTGSTIGCGQQDSAVSSAAIDQSNEVSWSLAVQSDANLPLCNSTSDGRLVYIKSTMQFVACNSGSWSPVDMKAVLGSGTSGTDGSNGKNSLLNIVAESAGANCADGGKKVLSGVDYNADGVLSDKEATNTSYICNGADGANGADGLAVASSWRYNYSGTLNTGATAQLIGQTAGFYLWLTNIELHKFTNGAAFVTVSGVRVANTLYDDVYDEHWSHSFFLAPTSLNQVITRKFGVVANTNFQFQVQLSEVPVFKAVLTYEGTPLVAVKSFSLTKQ